MINFDRLFASDTHGVINVWDRRLSSFPCLELASGSRSTINSVQLNPENQVRILYMYTTIHKSFEEYIVFLISYIVYM